MSPVESLNKVECRNVELAHLNLSAGPVSNSRMLPLNTPCAIGYGMRTRYLYCMGGMAINYF